MQINKNKSLKEFNTFGIQVFAKYFAEIESCEDILELLNKNFFVKNYLILKILQSKITLKNSFYNKEIFKYHNVKLILLRTNKICSFFY